MQAQLKGQRLGPRLKPKQVVFRPRIPNPEERPRQQRPVNVRRYIARPVAVELGKLLVRVMKDLPLASVKESFHPTATQEGRLGQIG